MKKKMNSVLASLLVCLVMIMPSITNGQGEKSVIKKYLQKIPAVRVRNTLQKYRMTAVYTNRDLYGNFLGKYKVSGDYTRGLENGFVKWNNIYISGSSSFSGPFPAGTKQDYMENMEYVPSQKMLGPQAFKNFPSTEESVLSRNLIWDMMGIEEFAWNYTDSLDLNKPFQIPDLKGEFNMADIGTYNHANIQLCWTGISAINNEICAVIEFRATDNKLELSMPALKTKGTEQYWGTVWISLKTHTIESAMLYSGTIQEIEVQSPKNKFIIKTIRDIKLEKIQ
ncbi:MAG: hypothetical protein Q8910_10850 [Bacteroidota bacterium]|nr:hypothetical protein [Bacteroidota bacterium]